MQSLPPLTCGVRVWGSVWHNSHLIVVTVVGATETVVTGIAAGVAAVLAGVAFIVSLGVSTGVTTSFFLT